MMQEIDNTLRDKVNSAWPSADAPLFDETWEAAQQRRTASRRLVQRFAGAAAVAAIAVIAMFGNEPPRESYIEVAELLESTYWTAPSDVLLPQRRFDIYQEMPELFESTEPAGGALL
jgi:hypothetical protein